jgi:hypothetical protein
MARICTTARFYGKTEIWCEAPVVVLGVARKDAFSSACCDPQATGDLDNALE